MIFFLCDAWLTFICWNRKVFTFTDYFWMAPRGTDVIRNLSNLTPKCFLCHCLWFTSLLSIQLHPKILLYTSAPCTKNHVALIWLTSLLSGWKLFRNRHIGFWGA